MQQTKSIALNNRTKGKIQRILAQQGTKTGAAKKIGINRNTMERLLITGTCSPETLAKIKIA